MRVVNYLSKELIDNGQLSVEDKEIFEYGAHYFIVIGAYLVLTMVIATYLNMLSYCIVFLMAFVLVRIYAGGCHMNTELGCFCGSLLLNVVAIVIIKMNWCNGYISNVIAVGCWIYIFIVSPIEAKRRPLEINERKYFGCLARIFLCMECIAVYFLQVCRLDKYAECIKVSWMILFVMLIVGKCQQVKNRVH